MSYANLVSQNCADKPEVFCNIRDFVCKLNGTYNDYSASGIGWTLHDASYAVDADNPQLNDWFVVKSTGESTKDTLYYLITWGSNQIGLYQNLVWNNVTHAGSSPQVGGTSVLAISETTSLNVDLNIFGDLDQVAVACEIISMATDYRSLLFGKVEKPFLGMSEDIATCSSSLSAGSDVSITVDTVPSTWMVGGELFIWTTTDTTVTAKIEKTTIKTLVGSTITCDLTNSYTADCRLSEHFGYFCQNTATLGNGYTLIGPDGSESVAMSGVYFDTGIAGSNADPGGYEDRYGMAPIAVSGSSGFLGYLRNVFAVGSTGLTVKDVLVTRDGTEYRYLKMYPSQYRVFKEV